MKAFHRLWLVVPGLYVLLAVVVQGATVTPLRNEMAELRVRITSRIASELRSSELLRTNSAIASSTASNRVRALARVQSGNPPPGRCVLSADRSDFSAGFGLTAGCVLK